MTEFPKNKEHVEEINPSCVTALIEIKKDVDSLLEEINIVETEENEKVSSREKIKNIKRRISVLPQKIKQKIKAAEGDDIEKLIGALQRILGEKNKRNAFFLAHNVEYLEPNIQEWFALIRDREIVVDLNDARADKTDHVMLKELVEKMKDASFPGGIEIFLQAKLGKWIGRNPATKKVKEIFDVKNHAKRMVEKHKRVEK